MDHNLALACIGYGSVRVLRERGFAEEPFAMPSSLILKESDPVEYCIDALKADHPEWVAKVGPGTRQAIRRKLEEESKRVRVN